MPFLAEDLYLRLPTADKKESVHLEEWPSIGVAASSILDNMDVARKVVELALFIRAQQNLKVRQPLVALTFQLGAKRPMLTEEVLAIIRDEVNVKTVSYDEEIRVSVENDEHLKIGESGDIIVALDTSLTPELKAEGMLRDIIRLIQEQRKHDNLVPDDKIALIYKGDPALEEIIEQNKAELQKIANISVFDRSTPDGGKLVLTELHSEGLTIAIRKV